MRIYTAHLRPHAAPVLLREGFSFAALLFGPLWLLAHRAWIAAALLFAAEAACALLLRGPPAVAVLITLALLGGWSGRDLVRWGLEQRGFVLVHVIAARNADAALARLLEARDDLIPLMAQLR